MSEECRLCGSTALALKGRQAGRVFFHCPGCDCAFLGATHLLIASEEKGRYLQHRNDPTPEYQAFLNRLALPLLTKLGGVQQGLDYGCGPVPVLSQILERAGHRMWNWDPFFFPTAESLAAAYDFITCSEAAEHFHRPAFEFDRLNGLLKKRGYLGVMTQMRGSWEGFFEWHYPRDPTHVIFYSPRTMQWIAKHFQWELEFFPDNVVIFQKV